MNFGYVLACTRNSKANAIQDGCHRIHNIRHGRSYTLHRKLPYEGHRLLLVSTQTSSNSCCIYMHSSVITKPI